jgi:hypothetical protein
MMIRGATFFDYKANGRLRASKGAGYVAKAARVSGIVNAINAAPTSQQRVEALQAALAQTDVRATALSAGVVTTLEASEAMANQLMVIGHRRADQDGRRALDTWRPACRETGRRSSPIRSRCWPPTRRPRPELGAASGSKERAKRRALVGLKACEV